MNTELDLLRNVHAFYNQDPSRWSKGFYASDKDGNPVDNWTEEPCDAASYCLWGAMEHITKSNLRNFSTLAPELSNQIFLTHMVELPEWNDDESTAFEDIMLMLETTIDLLEQLELPF